MKKTLGLVILGSVCAGALGFGLSGLGAHAAEIERGYISVYSEASEEAAPNMAKINLSVETSDKDITKATEANKQAANASIEAVKKLLDTSKGETIKTTAFNVSPEYSYKGNVRTFVRYNARNSVEVTIKDVSKLGKIISTALNNGANVVSNLSYSLDTNEESCNKLIQKAAKQARARANAAANAMVTSIDGIRSLNAQCTTNDYQRPVYRMSLKNAENAMDAAAGGVPTEEGTIKIRANVDASFFVK